MIVKHFRESSLLLTHPPKEDTIAVAITGLWCLKDYDNNVQQQCFSSDDRFVLTCLDCEAFPRIAM